MKRLPYTLTPFGRQVINLEYNRHRLIGNADVLMFVENQLNGLPLTNRSFFHFIIGSSKGYGLMTKL